MRKTSVLAILLAGLTAASLGMGGIHASATEETAADATNIDTVEELVPEEAATVDSVEEAVTVLGVDTVEEAPTAEAVVTEAEATAATATAPATTTIATTETVESVTTTTVEVAVVQEETPAVTTVTVPESDPVVTTVMTGEEQGAAPLNYYDEVVLMLDISGSMNGEPIEAMKEAATELCKTFLQNDPTTCISIVTFEDDVESLTYCNDLSTLENYIANISSGGGTYMYAGMEQVKLILNGSNGERKTVIIMADGMPTDGHEDIDYGYDSAQNASLQYDNENLKTDATVYSIGFFHSYYTDENAQFIRDLASDPNYSYIVEEGSDLSGVFQLIFHDITDTTEPEKSEGKTEASVAASTPVVGTESTPKTADRGIGIVVALMTVAGLGVVIGKRK